MPAEGDGTKRYASCLTFYDRVPHELCAKHEDLLGAKALKAICLLSHQPYLATSDKVPVPCASSAQSSAVLHRSCTTLKLQAAAGP